MTETSAPPVYYSLRGSKGNQGATDNNPLVAPVQRDWAGPHAQAPGAAGLRGLAVGADLSSPFAGTRIVEDIAGLSKAIEKGDWVAGSLATVGTAVDTVATVMDPIGTVLGMAAGWILDHVEPLKGWLNDLTGNAAEVNAGSTTWTNISGQLKASGEALAKTVTTTLADQHSQAVEAYKQLQKDIADSIGATGSLASAIATGLKVAATIVQVVHDMVRDAIADIIAKFASAALEEVLTAGLATPHVVANITAAVARWAKRLSTTIKELKTSFQALKELVTKAKEVLAKLKEILDKIKIGKVYDELANLKKGAERAASNAGHEAGSKLARALGRDVPTVKTKLGYPVDNVVESNNPRLWQMGQAPRGEEVDVLMGNNCGKNFHTLDKFDRATGEAISTKSLDTTMPSYQGRRLYYRVKGGIDKLMKFPGGQPTSGAYISPSHVKSSTLELAVPDEPLTEAQKTLLDEAKAYAKSEGAKLSVVVVK